MQASNAPSKSAVPFADSGTKNTIPVASQIGVTPGAASFTDGFPPLTMTPLAAGGVPPYGADFNGILNFLSAAARWAQAGASYPYDAAFAASIGGYPKGAVLWNADATGLWFNLADNNTSNPDSGGANWLALPSGIATTAEAQGLTNDTHALTPKKLADAFQGSNQSISAIGRQRQPGGLIEQWGKQTISLVGGTTVSAAVTFPQPFPTGCLAVNCNIVTLTPGAVSTQPGTVPTATGFDQYFFSASTSGSTTFFWRAVGY